MHGEETTCDTARSSTARISFQPQGEEQSKATVWMWWPQSLNISLWYLGSLWHLE